MDPQGILTASESLLGPSPRGAQAAPGDFFLISRTKASSGDGFLKASKIPYRTAQGTLGVLPSSVRLTTELSERSDRRTKMMEGEFREKLTAVIGGCVRNYNITGLVVPYNLPYAFLPAAS